MAWLCSLRPAVKQKAHRFVLAMVATPCATLAQTSVLSVRGEQLNGRPAKVGGSEVKLPESDSNRRHSGELALLEPLAAGVMCRVPWAYPVH